MLSRLKIPLLLAMLAPLSWAQMRGVPLFKLNFQFAAPLKLVPGSNQMLAPAAYSFPYNIGFTAGYIQEWNSAQRTMAIYSLSFDDDPINNLFDANLESKQNTPTFSGQTLYQMLTAKHLLQLGPVLRVGVAADLAVSLTRNSQAESFGKGLYNNNEYGLGAELTFSKIAKGPAALRTLQATGKITGRYAAFPNYSDASGRGEALLNSLAAGTTNSVRTNKEDVMRWVASLDASTEPLPGLVASLSYELSIDPSVQKYLLDRTGNQTARSETLTRNTLSGDLAWSLRPASLGRTLLTLGARVLYDGRSSDHLEQGSVATNLLGQIPADIRTNGLALGSGQVGLFFPDFLNESTLAIGPTFTLFLSRLVSTEFNYSYSRRDYGGKYARYGIGEAAGIDAGTYKAEKVWQNWQTFSLAFRFRHESGYRVFQPYLGYQYKDSNDRADLDGRYHIFFLGFKTSLEF